MCPTPGNASVSMYIFHADFLKRSKTQDDNVLQIFFSDEKIENVRSYISCFVSQKNIATQK